VKGRVPRLLGVFPDALVIVDAQCRIVQANAQAFAMFGFGEGQLIGTSLQTLFPGQRLPSSEGGPRRPGRAGRHVELVGMCSSSLRFRAAVTVMPIEAENNTSAIVSIRDVTEARENQFILERGLELLSTVISSA
jgi:two-component system, NarL family, sensor histidine kinase DevS